MRYDVLIKMLTLYVMAYSVEFFRTSSYCMKRLKAAGVSIYLAGFFLFPVAVSAQVAIEGTDYPPVVIQPEASTGLSAIYVLHSCQGNAAITYQSKNTSHPVWYTFGQLGAAYAEPIADGKIEYSGNTSILRDMRADCGYVIEDGNARTYFWLTDYSEYELLFGTLSVTEESDCHTTFLRLEGDAYPIYYYNINGRRLQLSRDITLTYSTMEYSADSQGYIETETVVTLADADGTIHCTSALCDTEYTLAGDRFLREWGLPEVTVSTNMIPARRVEAHTSAEQITETYDNQQKTSSGDAGTLGGSAPVDITFTAEVSPAATYVRFVAADAAGTCEYYSEVYQVNIGESDLHCPNAFSPQGSPGINDEWKVSYRSITDFKCSIFNRWGICVATLDHPSQGWDGKYKGKYVGSGVYYYVIKARGADGRQYNLKGDINIINYNNENNQGTTTPAP